MQPTQLWKNQRLTATNGRHRRHPAVWLIALSAGTVIALRLIARCVGRFAVAGASMEPSLTEGDRLLVLRLPTPLLRLRPGALVIARSPAAPGLEVVKRIAAIDRGPRRTTYVLLGDNPPLSTDSRHFGPVPETAITGRVIYRYWPDH
jgi:nickel-type superoxide dismutase maturation protease